MTTAATTAAPAAAAAERVCSLRIEIPTFNAEFVPEADGGPCTRAAVALLTVAHGDECDCGGLCLADPDSGEELEPWVERTLMCADHLYEIEASIFASNRPLHAATFTLL